MSRIRWSRKVMLLNMVLMYPLVLLGGYILWQKAQLIFLVYLLTWFGILTLGRYYVCRPCPYYGQDCPSFGFSHLARIFPKDDSGGFSRRAVVFDTSVVVLSLLVPIIVWTTGFFVEVLSFSPVEHALIGVYLILFIAMSRVHNITGCGKCDLVECPMSKAAKDART